MKRVFIVVLLCCASLTVPLCAQTKTVQATVSGGATSGDGRLSAFIGQPFFGQLSRGNHEFSFGVAQAQLVRDTVYEVLTYNEPYTENLFSLPAQTVAHKDSVYVVNGGIYRYDLLRILYLNVCPKNLTDDHGNTYDVLALSGHCWTKQNLRTPIDGARAYAGEFHPSAPEVYGLLYTWQAALNNTSADADGHVRGICPASSSGSWHLPDALEAGDLLAYPVDALRSEEGWLNAIYSNSTGFTAYPAGLYSSATARCEGIGTQTAWWTVGNASATDACQALQIDYYCGAPRILPRSSGDALSVRCVMKNVWPE